MGSDPPFRSAAIVGVGLLGGSLGLALRTRVGDVHVRGIGRDTARLKAAERLGAIDQGTTDLAAGVADRDLIVLATPIEHILETLGKLGPLAGPHTVVTDVGSTKRAICARAVEALPAAVPFIGGHPLAGKETAGIDAADADLFRRAPWILCPLRPARGALERLSKLVEALGAQPIVLTPDEHDRIAGWSSHLPQLLSTALAGVLGRSGETPERLAALSGSGLRDMTRLAGSHYAVWRGILETNRDNIDSALAAAATELESIRRDLAAGRLDAAFARGAQFYALARRTGKGAEGPHAGTHARKVLFLCTGNSCRSQMAEAIVNARLGGSWEAHSAGTHPAGFVHPNALRALEELGIRHEGRSKSIDEVRDLPFDLVVTVCDAAAEECPAWLGPGKRVHLGFSDPARSLGPDEVVMPHFRRVRDEIAAKVPALLERFGPSERRDSLVD